MGQDKQKKKKCENRGVNSVGDIFLEEKNR